VTFAVDATRYEAAPRFPAYLESVVKHAELWLGMYRTASVSSELVERLRRVRGSWRFLVLSEDWCGDCVSTIPVVARLAEQAGVDLKVLGRDANADLMDAHLTNGTRSVPVVMILDADFRERGWWGPRPAAVQRWYRNEAHMLPKEDRSRRKRAWYARDRGRTTVEEVVEAVERAARQAARSGAGQYISAGHRDH
jgi:thiol-disulfide isomerase/thioredoxin